MALTIGLRLGPYEITSAIGSGGMGEVYRAKDTRLDRTVAIKVLPSHLADQPELRERFEREARAIATMSHPHICSIYDIGRHDGIDFIVMEYLEGETLADRLYKGPLPLEQALQYAIEIAEALDKAHAAGLVHRDLKPGNIMLTKSGSKLLDFGLAKLRSDANKPGDSASQFATGNAPLTARGTLLGTLQYMAPEQLEGEEADARSDIFAFGEIVYEMLTGKRAFEGASQASLIAAILEREPPALSTLQPVTPEALDHFVRVCMKKNPADRWASAHDASLQLRWIAGHRETHVEKGAKSFAGERRLWMAITILLIALGGWAVVRGLSPATPGSAVRLFISRPETVPAMPQALAVSPDGQDIVFPIEGADGKSQLWIRRLDSQNAKALAGAENGTYPFWSPDGKFIGFFADGKLKKVEATGGQAQVLCDAPVPRGGTWNRDGVIVFAPVAAGPIHRVSASGGAPVPLFPQESRQRWPYFLPDGKHFLFLDQSDDKSRQGINLGSIDSKDTKRLLNVLSNAEFALPGYLVYGRNEGGTNGGGTLTAQRFDLKRLEMGDETFAIGPVAGTGIVYHSSFSVSANGVLAHQVEGISNFQFAWFDRSGRNLGPVGPPGLYDQVALSPDGQKLATSIKDSGRGTADIWLIDVLRGTRARLTSDPADELQPVWCSNERIAFTSGKPGNFAVVERPADEVGKERRLLESPDAKYVDDCSGDTLLFQSYGRDTQYDLFALNLNKDDNKPTAHLQTKDDESQQQLSPDGKWLLYTSNDSGRFEVYVRAFPSMSGKQQISANGGSDPRWRRDGREVFYLTPDQTTLMAADFTASPKPAGGLPHALFKTRLKYSLVFADQEFRYDVARDGQKFLMNTSPEESFAPISVILNWQALLKK